MPEDNSLQALKNQSTSDLEKISSRKDLVAFKNKYFSRKKGKLTLFLKNLKNLPEKDRGRIGGEANKFKQQLIADFNKKIEATVPQTQDFSNFDVTLPGVKKQIGSLHPLTQMQQTVADIFRSQNFTVYEGDELVSDYYNFESLNIPEHHPARDLWDTFYIKKESQDAKSDNLVLRTHTSSMQVKIMENAKPPLRCVIIGRCFRNEATDASHEHTFNQIEGFVVDENVTIGNLKETLQSLLSMIFKAEVSVRLRPSYFPFVEPGYELDFSCLHCNGKGCPACSNTGWVELLGCGMIHPEVFKAAGYPAGKYTGFAFGVGLDRLSMMKFGIPDVRLFNSGDLRFIKQF